MGAGVIWAIVIPMMLVLWALPIVAGVIAWNWSKKNPAAPPQAVSWVTCARCGSTYAGEDFEACPQCGQPQGGPPKSLIVQDWSEGRLRLLGVAAVWPFVYIAVFFATIGSFMTAIAQGRFVFWMFGCMFPLHFFTIILTLGLMVMYVLIALNSEFDENARIGWVVALFFGGWIAQLVAYIVLVYRPWIAAHPPAAPAVVAEAPTDRSPDV